MVFGIITQNEHYIIYNLSVVHLDLTTNKPFDRLSSNFQEIFLMVLRLASGQILMFKDH